jgi:hypothetical protein
LSEELAAAPASRRRLFEARDLTMGGLFGALAIVVPIVFHAVGMGKVFLPMYLPLLALGLLASWEVALTVGCVAPLLSALLTGMPPLAPPVAVLMMLELSAMATIASIVRSTGWGIWPAAILGILAARGVGALAVLTVLPLIGLQQNLGAYVAAAFVASLPGVVLLLTVVPGAVLMIERASLIGRPRRGEFKHE